jgi:hypothetical protein
MTSAQLDLVEGFDEGGAREDAERLGAAMTFRASMPDHT